jgi:hypothetical protein
MLPRRVSDETKKTKLEAGEKHDEGSIINYFTKDVKSKLELKSEAGSVWKRCGISLNKQRQRTVSNILIKLTAIYRR